MQELDIDSRIAIDKILKTHKDEVLTTKLIQHVNEEICNMYNKVLQ